MSGATAESFPPTEPALGPRQWMAVLLAIGCAIGAAYFNSLGVPFVFDDELSIPQNESLHAWSTALHPPAGGLTVSGRPVLNASFAFNYALSRNDPWSYHLFNVVIHAVAALALFQVTFRALRSTRIGRHAFAIAGVAVVLWALHPLQTESVTYTVQRAESLCGCLLLLTLAFFVAAAQRTRCDGPAILGFAAATVACALGMGTKEVMVVAPVLVALYDRTFLAPTWCELWRRRWLAYASLAATWLLVVALALGAGSRGNTFDFSLAGWARYELTQCVAFTRYVALALWPHPLVIDYGTFWTSGVAALAPHALAVVGAVVAFIAAVRRSPAVGFALAWAALTLAPSSLPPGKIQMIVEHRLYLPLAALTVLATAAAWRLGGRKGLFAALAAAMAMGLVTARRNVDYGSPVRLFTDTIAKRPNNARALALLADYERRAGNLTAARTWLEKSAAIDPTVAGVWSNLGTIWQELGDPASAVPCFQAALIRRPEDPAILTSLGRALVLANRAEEGIAALEAALRVDAADAPARAALANAFAAIDRMGDAAREFETLVRATPDDLPTRANYAEVLLTLRRPVAAAEQLEAAVRLAPHDAELRNRLGVAYGLSGRNGDALAAFQAALQIDPSHAEARENAAIAARRTRN